jgi:Holliday junction resolvase
MGKMSRNKGKVGEREFAALCRENGYADVHRTAQFKGKTGDAGDCEGLPGIHIEVKRVESLRLYDALDQSRRDATAAGNGDLPIVAHRKNQYDWIIIMDANDWFRLYREWEAGRSIGK